MVAMTSSSMLYLWCVVLRILRLPGAWVYVCVGMLKQLLVCRIRRLLVLAEWVV